MRDYNATIQKVVEYSVLYLLDVSDDEKSRKRRNQKVRDRMKKEKIEKKKKRKNEACNAPEIRRIFYVSALAGIPVNLTGLHTTILEDRVIAACSRYQCLR